MPRARPWRLPFLRSVISKERGSGEVENCRTKGRPPAQDGGRGSCPRSAALALGGCALRGNAGVARVPTGVRRGAGLKVCPHVHGVGLKVDPHDYMHGGFWPFGTHGRAGYVRAAPLLGTAPCLGYWWECLQGARVLGLSACGPRQPLDGNGPIWSTSASTAHRIRCSLPPCPAGMRGALRRDPLWPVSGSGIIMDLWRRWV